MQLLFQIALTCILSIPLAEGDQGPALPKCPGLEYERAYCDEKGCRCHKYTCKEGYHKVEAKDTEMGFECVKDKRVICPYGFAYDTFKAHCTKRPADPKKCGPDEHVECHSRRCSCFICPEGYEWSHADDTCTPIKTAAPPTSVPAGKCAVGYVRVCNERGCRCHQPVYNVLRRRIERSAPDECPPYYYRNKYGICMWTVCPLTFQQAVSVGYPEYRCYKNECIEGYHEVETAKKAKCIKDTPSNCPIGFKYDAVKEHCLKITKMALKCQAWEHRECKNGSCRCFNCPIDYVWSKTEEACKEMQSSGECLKGYIYKCDERNCRCMKTQ